MFVLHTGGNPESRSHGAYPGLLKSQKLAWSLDAVPRRSLSESRGLVFIQTLTPWTYLEQAMILFPEQERTRTPFKSREEGGTAAVALSAIIRMRSFGGIGPT